MSNFTDISDFVLDQIYGYQDATEVKDNTLRLRNAFDVEHVWSNTVDANLGKHTASFITAASGYLANECVVSANIADAAITHALIADNSIGNDQIRRTSNTVSNTFTTAGVNLYPTNNTTSFAPQFWTTGLALNYTVTGRVGPVAVPMNILDTIPILVVHMESSQTTTAKTMWCNMYYVPASPPHSFAGHEDWGLFVFFLRDKVTKQIRSSSMAEDPVWDGEWCSLPKNHPGRMLILPHPFHDHREGSETWDTHEVILLDLRSLNKEILSHPAKDKLDWLITQAPLFVSKGISSDQITKFENIQAEKAEIELVTTSQAQSKIAAAIAKRDEKLTVLAEIKAKKTQWEATNRAIKDGIINVHLNYKMGEIPVIPTTEEQIYIECDQEVEREKSKAGIRRKHEVLESQFKLQGKSLAQAFTEGLVPEAHEADDDLDKEELDLLPEKFKSKVRVVRNNSVKE